MANRKRNVSYVTQEEPAFLRRFKERVGYKDEPTLESKQKIPNFEDTDDRSDTEEDGPTVVVLRDGDLTAEEADAAHNKESADGDAEGESEGRVIFRKPVKRSSDANSDLNAVTNSKKKKGAGDASTGKDSDKKDQKKKQLSNKKLLSFGDEEEED